MRNQKGFSFIKKTIGYNATYFKLFPNLASCSARAITNCAYGPGDQVILKKCNLSDHESHAPNREEVVDLRITGAMKREAADHPEAPPAKRTSIH